MAQPSWDIKVAPDLRRCSLRFRILAAPLWFHWPVSLRSLFKVLHPKNMTLNQPKKRLFKDRLHMSSLPLALFILSIGIYGILNTSKLFWQGGLGEVECPLAAYPGREGDTLRGTWGTIQTSSEGQNHLAKSDKGISYVLHKGTQQNKKELVRILIQISLLYIRSMFLIS